MLNENFFVTLMKSEEVKKIGNCCCLVLFFIKFIELACTQMYLCKYLNMFLLDQKCSSSDTGRLSLNSFICLAIS